MEANPQIEMEHYIAAKLGMTIDRLRIEMTSAEYLSWCVYYGRIAQQRELELLKAKGG